MALYYAMKLTATLKRLYQKLKCRIENRSPPSSAAGDSTTEDRGAGSLLPLPKAVKPRKAADPEAHEQKIQIRMFLVSVMIVALVLGYIRYELKKMDFEPSEEIQFWDEKPQAGPVGINGTRKLLERPPKIGQCLHLVGNLSTDAERFCLTLADDWDIVNATCVVCAYFGAEPKIVYETYRDGRQQFYHEAPNPIPDPEDDDPKIDLRIRFLPDFVQIFAQRGEVGIFPKLPEVHQVRHVKLTGDVANLALLQIEGGYYETKQKKGFNYGERLDMTLKPAAPCDDPAVWGALLEGQPRKKSPNRKRSLVFIWGGGKRNCHNHYRDNDGLRVSDGRGMAKYKGSGRSKSRVSSLDGSWFGGRIGAGHSDYGIYKYSPTYGGYYNGRTSYKPSPSTPHFYTPASYSYLHWANETIVHVPSYGHGKNAYPKLFFSEARISKPVSMQIIFYQGYEYIDDLKTFTITFWFSDNTVVLTTGSGWGKDQANFLPIDDWRLFDLTIKPVDGRWKIYINNFEFATYAENSWLRDSDRFEIVGDVEVLGLKADGRLLREDIRQS